MVLRTSVVNPAWTSPTREHFLDPEAYKLPSLHQGKHCHQSKMELSNV